jgi:DNA-binding protein HU-beta
MKKSDLVDAISGKVGLPKGQVQQMVDDVFDLIADGLAKGEKIDLRGFGTFSVRESAARTGRNPQTGEPIAIPARRVPGFKPGKELKEKVNVDKPAAQA